MNQAKSSKEIIEDLKVEKDIFKKARLVEILRRSNEFPLLEIAKIISKHSSYVSHLIRLLRLPQLVVDGYYSKQISPTHLMLISRLQTEKQMAEAYEEILRKNLNVWQTEMLIRQLKYDVNTDDERLNPKEIAKMSKILSDELEARVRILQSRVRTKIVVEKRGNTGNSSKFIKEIFQKLRPGEQGKRVEVLE